MEGEASKTLDTAAQKKHAVMLDRLSNRHHLSTSSSAAAAGSPHFESVQSFLDRFSESKRSVEADLERCRRLATAPSAAAGLESGASDAKPDLEKASAAVAALEKFLAENSYFLPAYEVRTALRSISDLKETLEKANAELLPRKKFAFKNRPAKKDPTDSTGRALGEISISGAIPSERSDLAVRHSPGFRNREGAVLVKDFRVSPEEGEGDFSLSDLHSCEIYLRGRCRALFVNRLNNCKVFAGAVLASVLIEEVEGCLFMLASHQIRIHQSRATDFYLRVRSRPIIEDSSGVRFGPYGFCYEGLEGELRDSGLGDETGNWANVDDFRWLRAVQSPNWCVLPEADRVGNVCIPDLVDRVDAS